MVLSISSFEIVNFVVPNWNIYSLIAAFVAAAAVNPNEIKTLSANSLSTFPIKMNPVFSNSPKSQPKNSPDCPILCNWVFNNFISAEELLAKDLRRLETCALLNNISRKLISLLESSVTFH